MDALVAHRAPLVEPELALVERIGAAVQLLQHVVARQPRPEIGEVVFDHALDQLDDAAAVISPGDEVRPLLERRQRIGDGHGAFAHRQESMVVLRVAHADAVVRRELHFRERGGKAACLVHARRQHHHGALVEDDLQLEPELLDDVEDDLVLGCPGGDDHPADGQGRHVPLFERLYEGGGGPLCQRLLGVRRRRVEQRAVLGDDLVEDLQLPEMIREVVELAPRDQHQPPPGVLQLPERRQRRLAHLAVVGDGAVVIAGEDVVTHHAALPASSSHMRVESICM